MFFFIETIDASRRRMLVYFSPAGLVAAGEKINVSSLTLFLFPPRKISARSFRTRLFTQARRRLCGGGGWSMVFLKTLSLVSRSPRSFALHRIRYLGRCSAVVHSTSSVFTVSASRNSVTPWTLRCRRHSGIPSSIEATCVIN